MSLFYKRTFDIAISLQKDVKWCLTPDCQNVVVFDEKNEAIFICEICKKEYYLKCKVEYHKG